MESNPYSLLQQHRIKVCWKKKKANAKENKSFGGFMTEGRKVFENAEESIKWVSASDGFERSKNGAGIKDQARGPSARLHPHPFYFSGRNY